MSVTIGIHGATGKLGNMICAHTDCVVVPKEGIIPNCDIIIDVSSAKGTQSLVPRLKEEALLVGTTGDLPWKALEKYSKGAPVAVVPNFSVGIPLLIELVEKAVKHLPDGWDIEVIEVHHNQKKDAPSGTARRIVQTIQACGIADVPTHAMRLGDTFGEHTVWLSGPGERLELKHVATGRQVFAMGAIRWAKWLVNQPAGLIKP